MNKRELRIATDVITTIAKRENCTASEVRKNIEMAMLVGMCDPDPEVQESWKSIPKEGDVPTAEEVILCLAKRAQEKEGQILGREG